MIEERHRSSDEMTIILHKHRDAVLEELGFVDQIVSILEPEKSRTGE